MNSEYFIVEDVWREIKTYLFHNIKIHGKHLKNDKFVKNFNNVVKLIPRKYSCKLGPRIIYFSRSVHNGELFRFVKFLYKVPAPRFLKKNIPMYKLIIEIMENKGTTNKKIKEEYFKEIKPDKFSPKNN
tara:strand:- start:1336 stop:1722 length:387 start_codon:yes stop_codon:yes gene_type:complete